MSQVRAVVVRFRPWRTTSDRCGGVESCNEYVKVTVVTVAIDNLRILLVLIGITQTSGIEIFSDCHDYSQEQYHFCTRTVIIFVSSLLQ